MGEDLEKIIQRVGDANEERFFKSDRLLYGRGGATIYFSC